MTEKTIHPLANSPAELAREILQRLAAAGEEPTPEAYRALYDELTGAPASIETEGVFPRLARMLARTSTDTGFKLADMIEQRNWTAFCESIAHLVQAKSGNKKESPFSDFAQGVDRTQTWRDMLARALIYSLPSLFRSEPKLVAESERLGHLVKAVQSRQQISEAASEIKDLYLHIYQYSEARREKEMQFIRLMNLTLDSIKDALPPTGWVVHELQHFQQLIKEPMDEARLDKAILHLKEIIFKNRRV